MLFEYNNEVSKMKLTHGLAAIALSLTALSANAEVTGTVTAISDYDFRGITQTSLDPALQGSIDWASEGGFYAGAWASNIDFGDCCDENIEVDVYGGFRGGETVTYDLGLIYYTYPGAEYSNGDSLHYGEVYAALGWNWLSGKIWYSPDFGNADESAMYYEANASIPLPANFGATAHVGYSDGNYWDKFYDGGYMDWSVGVTYALGHFNLGLKYVDGSDLEVTDGQPDDVFTSESKAVFSVSTSFPWSKE